MLVGDICTWMGDQALWNVIMGGMYGVSRNGKRLLGDFFGADLAAAGRSHVREAASGRR